MPQGRLAHVGLGKESVFGTPVAVTDYTRFVSEGLMPDIEQVQSRSILSVFDPGQTYHGLKRHAGPIRVEIHPNVFGFLLLSALGPVTTTNPEPAIRWQHVFAARQTEFAAECVLQPLTFEMHKDLGQAFQFAGSVVNSLEMAFGVSDRIAVADAGIIAKSMARITKTTPTFEVTDPWRWHQAVIRLPDPTSFLTMRDFRLSLNNNMEGVDFIDGTQVIARIRPAADAFREILIRGRMLASSTEFDQYDTRGQRDLQIVLTGAALGTDFFKLTLDVPLFQYRTYPAGVAGPGEIYVDFEGQAVYSAATADTPMKATLMNSKSLY